MDVTVITIFIIGYLLIVFEHSVLIKKSATAIVTGVLCWNAPALFSTESIEHFGVLSVILFSLSTLTIVELVDTYRGFSLNVNSKKSQKLLDAICRFTFFLSGWLDRLEQDHRGHVPWEYLVHRTGTGGGILISGSAGEADAGGGKTNFTGYLKKISLPAIIGYFAGSYFISDHLSFLSSTQKFWVNLFSDQKIVQFNLTDPLEWKQ